VDFETRAIHEGQEPDPATGALTVPIYQTSTFVQDAVGEHKGYEYARVSNPTRTALQLCLASLEGAEHGVAFSSGLGAVTTIMHLLNPGDRVVAVADVYGGVYRMFSQVYQPKGYEFEWVPAEELNSDPAARLDERTRILWLETPTNPMLNGVDIHACAEAAHELGAMVVVDNTFASPYLQQPLALGADVVVHSTTKYLGGHSDLIGGFAPRTIRRPRALFFCRSLWGPCRAFDCWLVLRGIKTLAVRMRQHCANAEAVARTSSGIRGSRGALPRSTDASRAHGRGRQMRNFGGMVSFLAESEGGGRRLRADEALEARGGLGGSRPDRAPGTDDARLDRGRALRSRDLVRLSVGLESAEDLIADLEAALVRSAAAAGLKPKAPLAVPSSGRASFACASV
jgi:cystathionine beta-lyase/cystathionine gamma-synthase